MRLTVVRPEGWGVATPWTASCTRVRALLICEMLAGVLMVSEAQSRLEDAPSRMEKVWNTVLPSLVPIDKLAYFREFAARSLSSFVRENITSGSVTV